MASVAFWIFHGGADPVVKPELSRDAVKALKEAGATVKYTEYPGVGHDSWVKAYKEPELVDWLFCAEAEREVRVRGSGFRVQNAQFRAGPCRPGGGAGQRRGLPAIRRCAMSREDQAKESWKDYYAERASSADSCCSCGDPPAGALDHAVSIGYSTQEIRSVPEGTPLGLGCGNPTALAELKDGETVLDLGCGGGLDAFLAARRVGPKGKVIGVDLTPEMIERAKAGACKGGYENVEFRLGEIENLPIPDASVDVVISNCVINHVPDKPAVFKEALRVLKPGGRIDAADLTFEAVFTHGLQEEFQSACADGPQGKLDQAWSDWIAGALAKRDYLSAMDQAGFKDVAIVAEDLFPMAEQDERLRGKVLSLHVRGYKRSD